MTTLLAPRSMVREMLDELRNFIRAMVVADRGDDAGSTSFCWPRGL